MLRLIGAFAICIVCVMYGFNAADRLKRRRDFLNEFVTSLSVIETEITFGKYRLVKIFKQLGDSKKLYGLYASAADELEQYGIKKAWRRAVETAADTAGLKQGDIDAILALGAELGMSDIGGQKKAINRTAELVSACASDAAEAYARLARTYRGCGILAGVFVMIMLF